MKKVKSAYEASQENLEQNCIQTTKYEQIAKIEYFIIPNTWGHKPTCAPNFESAGVRVTAAQILLRPCMLTRKWHDIIIFCYKIYIQ